MESSSENLILDPYLQQFRHNFTGEVITIMVDRRLITIITQAATKYGLESSYMLTMAFIESAFNPKAYNSGSKASGMYQFLPSTARVYNLKNPFDPSAAADAAARFTLDNRKYISKHGVPTEGVFLYLAHQQGCGGIVAVYNAAYKGSALPSAIRKNMDSNAGKGKSPAQFISFWKSTYEAKAEKAMEFIQ